MKTTEHLKFKRSKESEELQLKQFYELTRTERAEYIEKLKQLEWSQLSERDKAIIYFWYQNWLLEKFPNPKKNFFSIE
jgi:hypothetical protein